MNYNKSNFTIRLNKNYELHEKEIREVEISLKNLRSDMKKFNGLLSKNVDSKDKLKLKFFDLEIEFKEKLTQMKNQSLKLELEIEVLRDEKTDILTQIMEVERQIHLWERKIKLQNKMQEVIKPKDGRKEIEEMYHALHRQEQNYKKFKLEQDKVIKNIEMEVDRWDYIKLKYPEQSKMSKTPGVISANSNMTRDINNLKEDLKFVTKEKQKVIRILQQRRDEWDKLREDYDREHDEQAYIEKQLSQIEMAKLSGLLERNDLACKTVQDQKCYKSVEDLINGKFKPRNKETVQKELEEMRNTNEEIISIIIKNATDIFDSDFGSEIVKRLQLDN